MHHPNRCRRGGWCAGDVVLSGWAEAQLTVEILTRAGASLTRKGVMQAQESLEGYKFTPLGPATITDKDHAALHRKQPQRSQNGGATYVGELICAPLQA